MAAPTPTPPRSSKDSRLLHVALWVAIGALIAAALVCVIWVLFGSQNGLIGRAFLTILLLAAFAGMAILDARLAARRPAWFALLSMVVWVATLLIGAFLIWMPERRLFYDYTRGFERFAAFLLIVLILQLGVLHVRLYTKAWLGRGTPFIRVVGWVTLVLVGLLAVMLVFPLMLNEWIEFHDIYWRLVVAITILAAVGTALVPLVNALLRPRAPREPLARGAYPAPGQLPPWPTYADGLTPLPMMPDGSPDWNAYYTGYPTVPQTYPAGGYDPHPYPARAGAQPAPGAPTPPAPPVAPWNPPPSPVPPVPEQPVPGQPAPGQPAPPQWGQAPSPAAPSPATTSQPVAPPPQGYPPAPPLPPQ